jgi:LytS/YehU family sensor histidine kinase
MKSYYKGKCEQQVEKANEAKSTLKNSEKNVDNLQKQVDPHFLLLSFNYFF